MKKREALVQGRIQSKAQRTEFWIMLLTDGVGGRLIVANCGRWAGMTQLWHEVSEKFGRMI